MEHTYDMTPGKCSGFIVLPGNAFYTLEYPNWKMFFDTNAKDDTLRSVIVHVWNKLSSNERIKKVGKKSAYEVLAIRNCPTVYQSSGDEF